MFNPDFAEGGKLALLWKNSMLPGAVLEDTRETQLPPPRFSCLLTATLLRKETEKTLQSTAPHRSTPGPWPSNPHPYHVPPLLPRALDTCRQSAHQFACPFACAEPNHAPRPFPTPVLTLTLH